MNLRGIAFITHRGHSGFQKTYERIKHSFIWGGMKMDIHGFNTSYDTCQQHKCERMKSPDALQTLPIPNHTWTYIFVDFIVGIHKERNKISIVVVVDHSTKYTYLCASPPTFTSSLTAQVFMNQTFKLHGMPTSIC